MKTYLVMFAEEERGHDDILEQCVLHVFGGLSTICEIYEIRILKRFNFEKKCRMMVCFQSNQVSGVIASFLHDCIRPLLKKYHVYMELFQFEKTYDCMIQELTYGEDVEDLLPCEIKFM